MRFSPDGSTLVYTRGYGRNDGPLRLILADAITGAPIAAPFPGGHNPRWCRLPGPPGPIPGALTGIVAESPDGVDHYVYVLELDCYIHYLPANRGQLDASADLLALSDLRQTVVQRGSKTPLTYPNARDPRLSASGVGAFRYPTTGELYIVGQDRLGPATEARWSSETLVWAFGGRVYGRTTPDIPTVDLTPPGHSVSQALPFWDAAMGRLYVGLAVATGPETADLWVFEWSELALRSVRGYRIGSSGGSGFDWDLTRNDDLRAAYLTPAGQLAIVNLASRALERLPDAPLPPPVLPDETFVVDPHGVIEDLASLLFSPDQGPSISFSPDGRHRFFCKSDEGSGDGPGQIGEDWDLDAHYIGHYEDSSAGQRVLHGQAVTPDTLPVSEDQKAALWASLPLNRNWWTDGARVWAPRRCVSGTVIRYVTDITWTTGYVQRNITIEIRVDVGHGVYNGKPVRARIVYASSSDGGRHFNLEVNYYGDPHGYNAWIAGPFSAI